MVHIFWSTSPYFTLSYIRIFTLFIQLDNLVNSPQERCESVRQQAILLQASCTCPQRGQTAHHPAQPFCPLSREHQLRIIIFFLQRRGRPIALLNTVLAAAG